MNAEPTLTRLIQVLDDSPARTGSRYAVAVAVINNPFGADFNDDIARRLAVFSEQLGESIMPGLAKLLDAPAGRYGKAAIAGAPGRERHMAQLLHPRLGKPIRAAINGGKALIPSTQKTGTFGASVDVPLCDKDDAWNFDALDTYTTSVASAPAADELVVVIVLAASVG